MTAAAGDGASIFCVVEFVKGSRVTTEPAPLRPAPGPGEPSLTSLPILQNGPPGTFVTFADGGRVPLPTDQIVLVDDTAGAARVGFGGMRFDGVEDGLLTFRRVRDLAAEHALSPERGRRMTLKRETVAAVFMEGRLAWGRPVGGTPHDS